MERSYPGNFFDKGGEFYQGKKSNKKPPEFKTPSEVVKKSLEIINEQCGKKVDA